MVAAQGEGRLEVSVGVEAPWHLSLEFPTKLVLDDARSFDREAAVESTETRLAYDVGAAAGLASGRISFGLCVQETCERVDHRFEVAAAD